MMVEDDQLDLEATSWARYDKAMAAFLGIFALEEQKRRRVVLKICILTKP